MKLLILSLLLIFTPYTSKPNSGGCLKMDIIILADYSSSVYDNHNYVIEAVNEFVNRFNLSEDGIRIGVTVFNTEVYEISNLTSNSKELKEKISGLHEAKPSGTTNLYGALLNANFQLSNSNREYVDKMIIIISDGAPNLPSKTEEIIYNMRNHHNKLQFCSVFVDSGSASEDFMIRISDLYVSTRYATLVETLERLDICF